MESDRAPPKSDNLYFPTKHQQLILTAPHIYIYIYIYIQTHTYIYICIYTLYMYVNHVFSVPCGHFRWNELRSSWPRCPSKCPAMASWPCRPRPRRHRRKSLALPRWPKCWWERRTTTGGTSCNRSRTRWAIWWFGERLVNFWWTSGEHLVNG